MADIKAYREIHRIGTPFIKGPWYQNQSPYQTNDDNCGVFGIRNGRKAAARRNFFLRANTKAAVRLWEPQIVTIVEQAVTKIKRDALKGTADVMKWWTMMTADVLGSLAFGEPFDMIQKEENPQMITDIEAVMILGGIKLELPWLWHFVKHIPVPGLHASHMGVTHRLREAGEVAVMNTKAAKKGSATTLFCKMYPDDDDPDAEPFLSDTLLSDEASNIIIAGSDTTAMALTYLVYEVLRHPEIKQKLVEELATCTPNPSWEELESKTYLNNVITETLRLHPPVGGTLPRTNPVGDVVFCGYKVPAATIVGTQAYTFQRDSDVFKNALSFDPDRWSKPTAEMREHFMPFGGTVRTCLGQNVARCELLHAVYRFFRECGSDERLRLMQNMTPEAVVPLDFFVMKPSCGKMDITMTGI